MNLIFSLFLIVRQKHLLHPEAQCTHGHSHTVPRTQSQHHCSMEHKTPVGCWPGFPAPFIQCDHVLDRRKQKLHGTVSTSDGANPNLATSDATYSRTGFPLIHHLFPVHSTSNVFLKAYNIISGGLEMLGSTRKMEQRVY